MYLNFTQVDTELTGTANSGRHEAWMGLRKNRAATQIPELQKKIRRFYVDSWCLARVGSAENVLESPYRPSF
jgi:hypothetical protein